MNTFLLIFNAFPAILQTVQAVEAAIPMSNSGQQKMNLVLNAAGTAWEVGAIGQQMNKTNVVSAVEAMTNVAVAGLNAAGVFSASHSAPPATAAPAVTPVAAIPVTPAPAAAPSAPAAPAPAAPVSSS